MKYLKLKLLILLMALCAASLAFSQAWGESRYVSAQSSAIKESPWFFARNSGGLSLGDEVTLLRDSGKWSQIRFGHATGWVSSSILSVRRIVPSGSIDITEVPLGGKGFSAAVELEYRREGLDYSMVDAMENFLLTSNELLNFIIDGRLGRGE